MTIHKYKLKVTDNQRVVMPTGATVLCLHMQDGVPTIWVECDEASPPCTVEFEMIGTGWVVSPRPRRYIGTVIDHDSGLVWHFFEITGTRENYCDA